MNKKLLFDLIFQNYHRHSHYSNIMTPDSSTTNEEYAKRAKELGHKILSSVEHGWQGRYYETFELAKKYDLKFIFGTEAYWVKDRHDEDRSNSHIVILAKNENGRRAINRILSEANITGYYYKPRVDMELLLSLPPKDVVITTACIGFWSYGIEISTNIILELHNHFKENLFLEVQYHNTDSQKKLNKYILELHNKYNIDIIMGCDSHYIYPEQAKDRDNVLEAKNIHYDSEEGWFMDYPSGEEAFNRFKNQGILNDDEIIQAMENTNICLTFDDITFNDDIKLPSLFPNYTQKQKNDLYFKLLTDSWLEYRKNIPKELHKKYIKEIAKEAQVVINTNMADYFILDYYIVKEGRKNGGIITHTGRGSGSSFFTNTLLGFSNIDRIQSPVMLYPERFMSETRILQTRSLPDLDMNLGTVEIFADAQEKLLGEGHSYPMIAFGTFKVKSAFKMYARAKELDFDIANDISKQIDKYESDLKHAEDDEKDLINIYDYVEEKYHSYIKESEKYQGIISDKKPHPCAYLVYMGNIKEELGLIKTKSKSSKKEKIVTVIDGAIAEKYKFLKNDLLKVEIVNTIDKIYKKIGIEQHSINELINITKNDKKTWDIYKNGYTMGVNQVEKNSTTKKAMKYAPSNISELTAFIAAIRPSFKSMYSIFEERKPFKYGIKAFDDIIQTEEMPNSFVLYQEQLMATLQYAGFPTDETYGIIKAIAKKHPEKVLPLKEKFMQGFKNKILETEDITDEKASEMTKAVWQIIENSCGYGFNASHAYCYCFDSLYGAYLKANYPYEFYSTMLNTYTEKGEKDKVGEFEKEMYEAFNIKLGHLKFGLDNREFSIDKENECIHPNLSSIKKLSQAVAENLYKLGMKNIKYDYFIDLIFNIHQNSICNMSQLKILTKLNYFSDYGKNQKLLDLIEVYEKKLKNKNLKDTTKEKRLIELREIENSIENKSMNIKDQIKAEKEYLGYEDTKIPNLQVNTYIVTEINDKYTPKIRLYNLKTGEIENLKCRKSDMKKSPFGEFSIILIKTTVERNKRKKVDNEWIQTDETELYLKDWKILM